MGKLEYLIKCARTIFLCTFAGTFVEEKDDDDIAYGLVHPLNSWDPIYTQV